jgi:hypothetical protein
MKKISATSSEIGEKHPPKRHAGGYRFYEQNETIIEDQTAHPGPALRRGRKKGKKGPSAAQVGDVLARRNKGM